MTFAQQLAIALIKSGLSNKDLAHRMGVSSTTVYRWKEGTLAPHPIMRDLVLEAAAGGKS